MNWFQSEDGIRGHYAEAREAEAQRHAETSRRINDEENAFLEAFRATRPATYSTPDLDALSQGLRNGEGGRLAFEGLRRGADKVERALCLAGFELARIKKGIGSFPVLVHAGRRGFWMVSDNATQGGVRPVFQATSGPDEGQPSGGHGYPDLRALFSLKGETQA